MGSSRVWAKVALLGLLSLLGCGANDDGAVVNVTNSAEFPVDVTIEVRGVPGKILCENDVCGPVTDPEVDALTQVLQPGESLDHSVGLRTQPTRLGYDVLDHFIVTIKTNQSSGDYQRRLFSSGVLAATPDLDASLIATLELDVTSLNNETLNADCTVEFQVEGGSKDCGFALLLS